MIVSLIAALDQSRIIGTGTGGLPWHLPADAEHFRSYCRGKVVLAGRITYGEMTGWFRATETLPLVLTARKLEDGTATTVPHPEEAVARALDLAPENEELVVVGGGATYRSMLPFADRLILTEIEAEFPGTVTFPEIDQREWNLVEEIPHPADQANSYAFTIRTLERLRSGKPPRSELPSAMDRTDEEWREKLTPEQFEVTRCSATEAPFTGCFHDHKEPGHYACVCCGQVLFASNAKYDSGSGWPSYWEPVSKEALSEVEDLSHGHVRTEVVCSGCKAHLGHLFTDGPKPTGLRYCINSASLSFLPESE